MRHVKHDVLDKQQKLVAGIWSSLCQGCTCSPQNFVSRQTKKRSQQFLLAAIMVIKSRNRERGFGSYGADRRPMKAKLHEAIKRGLQHATQTIVDAKIGSAASRTRGGQYVWNSWAAV